MTTEVLRNMLYAGQTLDALAAVVLDEVHYLQDAYRGPVWEEVIIHLPRRIRLVCLSATVSNAGELGEWIETVRGPTALVVETTRPVELEHHYAVGERNGSHVHVITTAKGPKANPAGFRFDIDPRARSRAKGRGQKGRGRPKRKWRTPTRGEVVDLLHQRSLLPAIYFIFSRAACDDAAASITASGLVLTTGDERDRIREILADRIGGVSGLDLDLLGYDEFRLGLEHGVAPHHAGMVPPFREAVEACFVEGLVKVVFATETLALGINMPARTVVIEKLSKFTGDHHELLTPAQYTQLTGRAGRRGIDRHGKAIVLWSPFVRFDQVADLALSRQFVLSSSFRPTYNMAANLVRRYDPERARQLLNLSFAQFRADAGVVRSEQQIERLHERRSQIVKRIERDHGPLDELRAAMATDRSSGDADTETIAFALSQLAPGNVIDVSGPEVPTPLVVLAVSFRNGGRVKVRAADPDGDVHELERGDLDEPPRVAGAIDLPEPYLPNSVTFVHEAVRTLARTRLVSPERRRQLGPTGRIRTVADVDPAARKALRRLERIDDDLRQFDAAANRRARSLAGQFDRVIDLLADRGHLELHRADGEWRLTPSGQRLARLYHECDLLIIEALEDGLFDRLDPPEVAALISVFTYTERGPASGGEPWFPSRRLRERYNRLLGLHLALTIDETDAQLPTSRGPDPGFVSIAHGWASGGDLGDVLADTEVTAGDFVRTSKQMIDLLHQLGGLASVPATAAAARAAADAVFRDLVSASSMLTEDEDEDEARDRADGDDRDDEDPVDGHDDVAVGDRVGNDADDGPGALPGTG